MISYISAGSAITASQLNALTAELDDALRVLFADKSWYVYRGMAGGVPEGTKFYFGDDSQWKIIPSLFGGSVTAYDHSTFTTAVAGFTIDTMEASNETAVVTYAGTWPLLGSLEAHSVVDAGTTYFYRQDTTGSGDYGEVERFKKLAVAEILIEANGSASFTWGSSYNKYHFLRFHNLDNQELTVTLPGGSTVVVPAFGVRAVRRTYPGANSWDTTYRYLWKAVSGDSLCWDSMPANNVGSMMCFHRWLDALSPAMAAGTVNGRDRAWTSKGFHLDPTEVYDGSAYLPQEISGSVELAKFEKHLGELCVWQNASDPTPTHASVTPTWATLAAGTGGIKLTAATGSVPHVLTIAADTGAVTPVDVFGLASTITPRKPMLLPFNVSLGATIVGDVVATDDKRIPGVSEYTLSATFTFYTDFGATANDVDHDVTWNQFGITAYGGSTSAEWNSPATASHWSTLSAHAAIVSTAGANEQATAPTITWKSDGWRLVACAQAEYPIALGVWPMSISLYPETQLATIDATDGFVLRCGNDILARDSWDITIRQQGRVMSDYVGTTAGSTVTHTGHPDIIGEDPLKGGVEWRENRGETYAVVTNRTESITITQAGTKTLPVFVGNDSAEFVGRSHSDPAWYAAHRADLIAGTVPFQAQQEVVRLHILALHYNHIAQRLNAIYAIDPFTYDEVVYYGDLAEGSWPFAVVPPDYQVNTIATGSIADDLAMTVNSLTINGTTGYWVSQTDCQTWAAAAGFRYHSQRIFGLCDHFSGSESVITSYMTEADNTYPYRYRPSLAGVVYGVVAVDDGSTRGPKSYGPVVPFPVLTEGAMLELESKVTNGPTPPTGWTLDAASWVFTYAHSTLHYDNSPLSLANLIDDWEPFSVTPAAPIGPALWPLTDLPQYIAPQDIADLYGETAGALEAYKLMIIPRFLFLRS